MIDWLGIEDGVDQGGDVIEDLEECVAEEAILGGLDVVNSQAGGMDDVSVSLPE